MSEKPVETNFKFTFKTKNLQHFLTFSYKDLHFYNVIPESFSLFY